MCVCVFMLGFALVLLSAGTAWLFVCALGYTSEAVLGKQMVGLWSSEPDLSACLSLSPSFCRYKTFLSEDAGPETLVAIVHAKDPDGDGVTYAITGGNEDSNFELDNQKGE